jgi:two-component system LytT family sensor kinase
MKESRIKLAGIAVYFTLNISSGWMFSEDSISTTLLLLGATLTTLVLQWEVSYRLHLLARKKYPGITLLKQRIIFLLVSVFLSAFLVQLATDVLMDPVITDNNYPLDIFRILGLVMQAFGFSATSIGLFEAYYNYSNLLKSEREKEELLRLNLKSRFDSLKSQVNPHFLFNSLNTLSSLIHKDAAKAEQFVEELSNVYRYLLRTNEQELNSLQSEMEFIQSYIHLLTTRFGTNLRFEPDVEDRYLDCFLPPLTLQLLVENAVKHNVISKEKPLTIRLFTKNDQLHIVNNIQKKQREVLSEKTGLANIISKYRLLKQAEVLIEETAAEFVVILPLTKTRNHEGIDR